METFVEVMFDYGFENIFVFDSTIHQLAIKDSRVTRSKNWINCVSEANCVVFGTAHDDIKAINPSELAELMADDKLVYDGRRYFSKDEVKELQSLGVCYRGVGRSFE